MRVPYGEGVASHTGPESCVGVREDDGEALTGVRAGWAIEPRKVFVRDAQAVLVAEGNTGSLAKRERPDPAGSKTPCTHASTSQERTTLSYGSREVPRPTWAPAQARAVNP